MIVHITENFENLGIATFVGVILQTEFPIHLIIIVFDKSLDIFGQHRKVPSTKYSPNEITK